MSLTYRVAPLGDWPDETPAGKRRPAQFSAHWGDTLDLLDREIGQLAGKNVVMQLGVRDRDIRNDGGVRADARIDFPGARISFDSKHGPMTYGTDVFSGAVVWRGVRAGSTRVPGWQCNVRAIALALEALRKVDRYGISHRGEQYQGWSALPPGTGQAVVATGGMTKGDAAALIHRVADYDSATTPIALVYRRARSKAHPDRNGGDRALWDQVEQAAHVLGLDR